MLVVKKERKKKHIRTTFVITRVTPEEKKMLLKKCGGNGNLSVMLRFMLGLENVPGVDSYIPPEQ